MHNAAGRCIRRQETDLCREVNVARRVDEVDQELTSVGVLGHLVVRNLLLRIPMRRTRCAGGDCRRQDGCAGGDEDTTRRNSGHTQHTAQNAIGSQKKQITTQVVPNTKEHRQEAEEGTARTTKSTSTREHTHATFMIHTEVQERQRQNRQKRTGGHMGQTNARRYRCALAAAATSDTASRTPAGHGFEPDRADLVVKRDASRLDGDTTVRLVLARVGQTLVAGTSHGDNTSRRHKRVRKSRLACSSPSVSR